MIICRGTPEYKGRYVCYLPGVGVATVIRDWVPGVGWCTFQFEPIAGKVAGWIGPLPAFPENSVSPPKPEYDL